MIPKIIHYCWFGRGEYSEKMRACIDSWNQLKPDYEIKLWNEDAFDVNEFAFACQAYAAGKYAFVSDMVRFYALFKYGGVYLDTDVEVLKPFSELMDQGVILSSDESGNIDGAFIGGEANHPFFADMLQRYQSMRFANDDGSLNQIVVNYWMQEELKKYGYSSSKKMQRLENHMTVYPMEFFCAMNQITGKVCSTDKTYCVHHHTYSWTSRKTNLIRHIRTKILVPIMGADAYARFSDSLRKITRHRNYKG